MQTQTRSRKSEVGSQNEQPFGINYSWADSKGRMHLGRSVGTGRDRAHAERRFFNQHRHVMREEGSAVISLPVVVVLIVLAALMFTGCDSHPSNVGKDTVISDGFSSFGHAREFTFNGHAYVIVTFGGEAGGAICHAEDCPCKTKTPVEGGAK